MIMLATNEAMKEAPTALGEYFFEFMTEMAMCHRGDADATIP